MKSLLLIIGVLTGIAATHVTAQEREGVIHYQVKVNVHRTLPPEREAMKDMIPEFRTHSDQLFFNSEESLYKPVEEIPDSGPGRGPGMRMRRPRSEMYINRSENVRLALQEFLGKKYLVEDTLRVHPWRIGAETKTINGYLCRKAVLVEEQERRRDIEAWYTDQLPSFLGPENFNTLPGTVLAVDINQGERTIQATEIQLRPLNKNELYRPTAKSKMTEDEYRQMVREQMERMRANGRDFVIRD